MFLLFLKDETQEIRKSEKAGSDEHYGNAVNISEEPFDPDFQVSTWDDSILGE